MSRTDFRVPDLIEREAAIDPQRSFIVQAPAGSGKTGLLIQRFLRLLATVERPEEILAITFTRKAAGEMHKRIFDALKEAAGETGSMDVNRLKTIELAKKALERDRERGWDLRENPSRLKVQTIDSFCAHLSRQIPVLSRLGLNLSVTDLPQHLYREAARRTIARIDGNDDGALAVLAALAHLDNSMTILEERIVGMLSRRDQWLLHFEPERWEGDAIRGELEKGLRDAINDHLARLSGIFPPELLSRVLEYGRFAARNLRDASDRKREIIIGLSDLRSVPGDGADDLCAWLGIAELLMTDTGEWRKPGGVNARIGFPADKVAKDFKEGFQQLLTTLAGHDDLAGLLDGVRTLPSPVYSEEEWEILKAVTAILPLAVGDLRSVFAERGEVDFQEVSIAAVGALGSSEDPSDMLLRIDMSLRHILVDEYQDTSRAQLKLIETITSGWEPGDGRTLFVVGDPMQSIYLFREAEVGLFLDAKGRGIGDLRLEPLVLRSNFRSQERIVDWVNRSFKEIFPAVEDPRAGAVGYEESAAVEEGLPGEGVKSVIYDGRDDVGEACDIAGLVKEIRKGSTEDSIAVLARARTHLPEITKALRAEEIPYSVKKVDLLADRPVVLDLYSLLRALMHPLDRVAWLSVLRAPWCGISLPDIHALCSGDRQTPVWELINDGSRIAGISDDGRRRLGYFAECFGRALPLRRRVSPRELVEGLWIDLNGPAACGAEAMKDAEIFLDLIDSMTTAGEIISFGLLRERMGELYADEGGGGMEGVQIMTVHNAKGLEFDHVIIPGMGKGTGRGEKEMIVWLERGDDLLIAPVERRGEATGTTYAYIKRLQREKEDNEKARLLYVAATRAKKRLHLFGHVKTDENGSDIKATPGSFLELVMDHIDAGTPVGTKRTGDMGEAGEATASSPRMLRRLAEPWKKVEPPAPVRTVSMVEEAAFLQKAPVFEWAGDASRHIGTVVHRYLSRIADEGVSGWNVERVRGETRRMTAMLTQLGLSGDEAGESSERSMEILSRMLTDDRGRWILGSHAEAASELPISGTVRGKVVHAVIDRTFVDNGVRWIIDYKTGGHGGGSVEEFLDSEKERYRDQLEIYAELLEKTGEGCAIRKALYYPALAAWIEV